MQRLTRWFQVNNLTIYVLGIMTGLFLASLLWSFNLTNTNELANWQAGLLQNFSTEMLGGILTFILFQLFLGNKEKVKELVAARAKATQEEKRKLLVDLRDKYKGANSLAHLRENGWLLDGTCNGADLFEAHLPNANFCAGNLQGTSFTQANLQDAWFAGTKLQESRFFTANLENAIFNQAQLQNANLEWANLKGANLKEADLKGANLRSVCLEYANLREAYLEGVDLTNAKFNEKTILPDTKIIGMDEQFKPIFDKLWTSNTEMSCYTDPNHPNFFRPEWLKSKE
jgi:uncharacterized protein YjbI with pentapeptide repeats